MERHLRPWERVAGRAAMYAARLAKRVLPGAVTRRFSAFFHHARPPPVHRLARSAGARRLRDAARRLRAPALAEDRGVGGAAQPAPFDRRQRPRDDQAGEVRGLVAVDRAPRPPQQRSARRTRSSAGRQGRGRSARRARARPPAARATSASWSSRKRWRGASTCGQRPPSTRKPNARGFGVATTSTPPGSRLRAAASTRSHGRGTCSRTCQAAMTRLDDMPSGPPLAPPTAPSRRRPPRAGTRRRGRRPRSLPPRSRRRAPGSRRSRCRARSPSAARAEPRAPRPTPSASARAWPARAGPRGRAARSSRRGSRRRGRRARSRGAASGRPCIGDSGTARRVIARLRSVVVKAASVAPPQSGQAVIAARPHLGREAADGEQQQREEQQREDRGHEIGQPGEARRARRPRRRR